MKYLYLILLSIICISCKLWAQEIVETAYYAENPDLGGEGLIQKSIQTFDKDKTIVTFYIEMASAGNYYANFWLCPSMNKKGVFSDYSVKVNATSIGTIRPQKGGWQSIGLMYDQIIFLNEGINTISIIGDAPAIPNVEHVKLASLLQKARISSELYDKYIQNIQFGTIANKQADNEMQSTLSYEEKQNKKYINRLNASYSSTEDPLYDYEYETNITANYTYYTTFAFTQGQHVSISTTEIDNLKHVLYFFSLSDPEEYSWATRSNATSHSTSLDITIPQTGLYHVLVRSNENGRAGYCNLNVNNNHFPNIPINCTRIKCNIDTLNTYNFFTVKSQGNPRIWIEEENSILSYGKICCYNDSYQGSGYFDWGTNARIKKRFNQPAQAVLVSHYGAYSPVSRLDLYMKCKESDLASRHTNYHQDDAIQSSPESYYYNCFSWSGGITSYWEYPFATFSDFRDTDALRSFDNFYNSRGLTRIGANSTNAVVALWADVDDDGSRYYSHASVRQGDGNLHGYDWESKIGRLARVFHTKNALNSYGQIVEYYTNVSNTQTSTRSCLDAEIADGTARIEYMNFDDEEIRLISDSISNIKTATRNQFLNLFAMWKNKFEKSIHSSHHIIKKCEEYKNTIELCTSNPELQYLIFDYVNKGDICAMMLLEDLIGNVSKYFTLDTQTIEKESHCSCKTYRTPLTNCIACIKNVLHHNETEYANAKSIIAPTKTTGISYSNSLDFKVQQLQNNISITYNLPIDSKVTLEVLDLSGKTIAVSIRENELDAGMHTHILNIKPFGLFLVKLTVNGCVNIKKIHS